MKVLLKKTALLFMVCVVLISMFFTSSNMQVHASSAKWKKACKAYSAFLMKNESRFRAKEGEFERKNGENFKKSDSFLIVDLDKNGVPELIVKHPIAYKSDYLYVYTYRSGKVTQVKNTDGKKGKNGFININCNANGWYYVYKCSNHHLHTDWYSGMVGSEDSAYIVKKGKLKLYAKSEEIYLTGKQKSFYTVNGKKVSAAKYQAATKKCGSVQTVLEKNTKLNRKKYLK